MSLFIGNMTFLKTFCSVICGGEEEQKAQNDGQSTSFNVFKRIF